MSPRDRSDRGRLLASLGGLLVLLASCGHDACSRPHQPQGEQPTLIRRVASPPEATPAWIDISRDQPLFLVAGMRGPVRIWNELENNATAVAPIPVAGSILAARFSDGGVFFALEQGAVTLWDWHEGRARFTHDFGRRGRRAAISLDAAYAALGGTVVELAAGREVGETKAIASQSALAFSANGRHVVSAGFQEPWIAVRDLPDGAVREWLAPGKVSQAALSSSGDIVAASMEDGAVHFWRQPGGEALGQWQGPGEVRGLCFNPTDASVVVAGPLGVSVVDVAGAQQTWRSNVDGTLWVFACDGDLVAAGTTAGGLWLWDVARHVLRARLQLSSSAVIAVSVNSARHRIAAADEKGVAAIWGWR